MKEEEGARTIACPHKVSCYFISCFHNKERLLIGKVPSFIFVFDCKKVYGLLPCSCIFVSVCTFIHFAAV